VRSTDQRNRSWCLAHEFPLKFPRTAGEGVNSARGPVRVSRYRCHSGCNLRMPTSRGRTAQSRRACQCVELRKIARRICVKLPFEKNSGCEGARCDFECREAWLGHFRYRNELFYDGPSAGKEYLACAGEDQQNTERPRKRYDSARFNNRLPFPELHFLFFRGHAHLRPKQRDDSAGDQQNSDNCDGMKLHHKKPSESASLCRCSSLRLSG
jgi:hypothetical protein